MKTLKEALIDKGNDVTKNIDATLLGFLKDCPPEFMDKVNPKEVFKWKNSQLEINLSALPIISTRLSGIFIDYITMYQQYNIKNIIFTGEYKYPIYIYGKVLPKDVIVNMEYRNPNKMLDSIISGIMKIEPDTQHLKYNLKNIKYNLINMHQYPVLDDYLWALGADNYYKLGNYLSVGGYLPTDVLLNHEDIRNIQQNTEFYKNLWDNHKISQLLTNDYIYDIILEKLKKYIYFPFSDIKKASNSNEFDKTKWDLNEYEIYFYAPNISTGKKLAQQFIKDDSTPVTSYKIIKDFIVLYCK